MSELDDYDGSLGGLDDDVEEGFSDEDGIQRSSSGGGSDGAGSEAYDDFAVDDGVGDNDDGSSCSSSSGSAGGGGDDGDSKTQGGSQLTSTTLNQNLFGILLNPNPEPSLQNGVPQQRRTESSVAPPASQKAKKKKSKKPKSPPRKTSDYDFEELMSASGVGGDGDGDGDEFDDGDGESLMGSVANLPSSLQQPSSGSKPAMAFNPFYVAENMYPGELQSSMQERADLLNLYEMLKRRGLTSKHDIENLPLEDLRFEVYRLQRLDEMGDAVDDYKTTMILAMNIIEGFAPIVYNWTGLMLNGVSFRMHMAMERGDMNRAFQGIYHKRAKHGPTSPEIALGWAIIKCFANVHNDNKRQIQQQYNPIYRTQPQQYYYQQPPPPQTYYQPEPLPSQQRAPPPNSFDFYGEVRRPQLAEATQQKPQSNGTIADLFAGVVGLFGGGGSAPAQMPTAAVAQPHPAMAGTAQNQDPAYSSPNQQTPAPQFQTSQTFVAPPAQSNPTQLKDRLKMLRSRMNE